MFAGNLNSPVRDIHVVDIRNKYLKYNTTPMNTCMRTNLMIQYHEYVYMKCIIIWIRYM